MKTISFLLILFSLTASSISADPGPVRISGHPDYPPFSWQEGDQIVGASIKLATSIFDALEIPYKTHAIGSWKRVQEHAKCGRIDLIAGINKNSPRSEYIDFTLPYSNDPTSVFVKKGYSFEFNGWDDLIGKKGAALQGGSFGTELDAFIAERLYMVRMFSREASFLRLKEQRSHFVLCGYYPCMIYAKKHGFWDDIEILPKYAIVEKMHMGFCNHSRFLSFLPEINNQIERLRKNGQIQHWINEYMEIYLNKPHPKTRNP